MPPLPPLRHIEPVMMDVDEHPVVCLQDPLGVIDDPILLSPLAFIVALHLDGKRDLAAVRQAFAESCKGQQVTEKQVLDLVQSLDEAGYLATDAFYVMRARKENAFRAQHVRAPRLSGEAYPDSLDELRRYLSDFLSSAPKAAPAARPLAGLIAPHIDFERGRAAYGAAYGRLSVEAKPETALLFGVAHCGGETPFILTRKHFETPFGQLKTDQDCVSALEACSPWDPYASEMAHRLEHSLEFQAVMLGRLYGTDLRIAPVLCAFPEPDVKRTSGEWDDIRGFLATCNQLVRQHEGRMLVIAAADLAHVGRCFGDETDITETVREATRARDKSDLAHASALDGEAFLDAVLSDGNQRRVCGLGCIYAALKSLEGWATAGELLEYGQAPDPADGMVSFAAMALTR